MLCVCDVKETRNEMKLQLGVALWWKLFICDTEKMTLPSKTSFGIYAMRTIFQQRLHLS